VVQFYSSLVKFKCIRAHHQVTRLQTAAVHKTHNFPQGGGKLVKGHTQYLNVLKQLECRTSNLYDFWLQLNHAVNWCVFNSTHLQLHATL